MDDKKIPKGLNVNNRRCNLRIKTKQDKKRTLKEFDLKSENEVEKCY